MAGTLSTLILSSSPHVLPGNHVGGRLGVCVNLVLLPWCVLLLAALVTVLS